MTRIRVLVADDHPIVRDGVKFALEQQAPDVTVVAEAADGMDVVKRAGRGEVDVYVLDVTMPRMNGIETARNILSLEPEAKVVLLTMHNSQRVVEAALDVGVLGYVLKEAMSGELATAIRRAFAGKRHFGKGVRLPEDGRPRFDAAPLSDREKEIARAIAEGLTSKEIADRLGISANTVQVHRRNLMQKLGVHKETDIVRLVVNEGALEL
jgi:DNA-binding NarL/FixJ family response regulator